MDLIRENLKFELSTSLYLSSNLQAIQLNCYCHLSNQCNLTQVCFVYFHYYCDMCVETPHMYVFTREMASSTTVGSYYSICSSS